MKKTLRKALEMRTAIRNKIVGGTSGKMFNFREEKKLNVTGKMDWKRKK